MCESWKISRNYGIFLTCFEYGKNNNICCTDIFEDDTDKQKAIAQFIDVRYNVRKKILEKQEGGQASNSGSYASGWTLWALYFTEWNKWWWWG